MNYPRFNRLSSCLLVIPLILSASVAFAQTKPAPGTPVVTTSTAPITLSAFEVSSDRDVGYTASSALAGGRIDSLLKETPSARPVRLS